MYLKSDGTAQDLCKKLQENRGLFLRYTLPAIAYVLYDNLTFVNLTFFDPVTYSILAEEDLCLFEQVFLGKVLTRGIAARNLWVGSHFSLGMPQGQRQHEAVQKKPAQEVVSCFIGHHSLASLAIIMILEMGQPSEIFFKFIHHKIF